MIEMITRKKDRERGCTLQFSLSHTYIHTYFICHVGR